MQDHQKERPGSGNMQESPAQTETGLKSVYTKAADRAIYFRMN
jgi:hypothetical protein